MCETGNYEEENLEFDKELLALFRRYESNVKCELSEKDMIEITNEALIYDFLITVIDRLPGVVERDKRGEHES